jgi:hypothetical protein
MVKGDGLCSSKPEFRGISLIVESPTTQSKFDGSISLKFHIRILLFPPAQSTLASGWQWVRLSFVTGKPNIQAHGIAWITWIVSLVWIARRWITSDYCSSSVGRASVVTVGSVISALAVLTALSILLFASTCSWSITGTTGTSCVRLKRPRAT